MLIRVVSQTQTRAVIVFFLSNMDQSYESDADQSSVSDTDESGDLFSSSVRHRSEW